VIVGDITYVPLKNGKWAYLATWIDLSSRRVLGWAIREDMTENLIIEAFLMLLRKVRLPAGCVIHSDRGGQYPSKKSRRLLGIHGCRQSMSRAGETMNLYRVYAPTEYSSKHLITKGHCNNCGFDDIYCRFHA